MTKDQMIEYITASRWRVYEVRGGIELRVEAEGIFEFYKKRGQKELVSVIYESKNRVVSFAMVRAKSRPSSIVWDQNNKTITLDFFHRHDNDVERFNLVFHTDDDGYPFEFFSFDVSSQGSFMSHVGTGGGGRD